ncbi:echinoderm microtubule-associated protein-like 2 isoform X3 [Hermetia illucens]|uniref:echinoderm microtubule-associated protein-like 2 isoform X3 n=1 Tax=Hermetia illucens TaxID=343691 RepID=UPI0018CC1AD4|nr:echinoderm microtubule-associated protein-like 2 isoform X3 [Hermetia illucens]
MAVNHENDDDTMAGVYMAWHEMLESEKSSLAGRVHDLERRVLTQQDEIVCLRSTLADVLRRLNLIEGNIERNGPATTPSSITHGGRSAPSTPARSAPVPTFNRLTSPSPTNNSSSSTSSSNDWKLRRTLTRATPTNQTESVVLRRSTVTGSTLAHRNKAIHQSNGSLHSDSHSSSSVSPAPSPSPRPNSLHSGLGKRWSSTGDFGASGAQLQGRFSARSLLNLTTKPLTSQLIKHGTHTATYNEEEGALKLFLRGRPIILYAPSDVRDNFDISKVSPAPNRKLKLDWVYGYRGKDCRSNLYQLPTGEMAYFVAAAVVLYNPDEQCQRHYLGHTDDVKSLAIHPNKLLVATGQCAGHDRREALPHIRVWNSVSLATVAVIGAGEFTGSVNCISFSRADGGSLLTAIDDSPEKIISVWDWQKGEKGLRVTETRCSVDTVVAGEFHPLDRSQIITVGKGHVAFWTLDQNGTLYKRMGVFESREKPKYVTCIAFTQSGDVITGDSNGNIIVWSRGTNTISRFFKKVHDGSIFSLCTLKDGGLISGGGKDGRLVLFDSEMNRSGVEGFVEPHFGAIRVVSEGKGSQLLIGTTRNCILIGSFDLGFNPVVMGHVDELWGLAAHPNMAQFVTGGFDQLLQLWDSLSHSVVWSKDIGEHIQSCAFSPDGEYIAVGGISGRWMVFDTTSRELLAQLSDGQEPIQTIKFSPDGQFLAIGSRDNSVYIYQINGNSRRFARVGRCSGHSSYIKHIDWSEDSQVIRSNSGDYEILFWNASTCRQITSASSLRDVKWASQTCTLSFNTVGIWPEHADGTDVNSAARSNDSTILASGDDFGKVKLYSFPAAQPKSLCHLYGGHSSHVTAVEFLCDDTRVISTGGNDTSVMQWTVI